MNKDLKYYKFINCLTGNVIRFISFPGDEPNPRGLLEEERRKLAYENNLYVENIYYLLYTENDFDK